MLRGFAELNSPFRWTASYGSFRETISGVDKSGELFIFDTVIVDQTFYVPLFWALKMLTVSF